MSGKIIRQELDIEVQAGSGDFMAEHVQVDRKVGRDAGVAKLEGIYADAYIPSLNDEVRVTVNGNRIFTGTAKRATRNEEGTYKIEAYDAKRRMSRITVNISSQNNDSYNSKVASRLLSKHGFKYDISGPFPGYDGPTRHDKKDVPLHRVMDDIAARLDAYWWVDSKNVVNLSADLPSGSEELRYITKIGGGGSKSAKNTVTVFGGSPASSKGQQWAKMVAENEITSESKFVSGDGEKAKKTLKNQNLTTQAEVNAVAKSQIGKYAMDHKVGQATIVGDSSYNLYQTVTVPSMDITEDLLAGDYMVRGITHVLDAMQGYTTTIKFGLPKDKVDAAKAGQIDVNVGITD